jgi:AraC family transcriptional regulator
MPNDAAANLQNLLRAAEPVRAGGPVRTGGLPAHKLSKVLDFIDSSLARSVGVRDLAATVHMSPFHFARMFRQTTGQPPHAYITTKRIEQAKELLANSNLRIVEVAVSVGYQTQAHFTGVFHKYVGVTPRVYRLGAQAQRHGTPRGNGEVQASGGGTSATLGAAAALEHLGLVGT